jgi:hypothetical protein
MFRYSICDPLRKDPIEMGDIAKEKILDILEKFPWLDLLAKMNSVDANQLHYSPSLEFENKLNKHGLSISIIENDNGHEYYIFYKRPKLVRKFFGLINEMNSDYLSERTGQSKRDVQEAVTALINNDLATLENRWG